MSEALTELLVECYEDPGLFHEAVLGRPPLHDKQELIAESVVRNRITVVPAAHAVGKSWYAATAVLHWLYTRPGGKVITTSASNTQLVSVLWAAIKTAYSKSLIPLEGTISQGHAIPQRLELAPEWYAIGFSAKQPENFSGFHGDEILVVADESSGIEQPIWDAIEALGYTSLLALGNPIRASGHFRALYDQAVAGAPGYAGYRLTAFDSPHAHLTDEEIKERGLKPGLTSKTWIDRVKRLYGEASLYWRTRVLALFPEEDHDQLIPSEWLDRCYLAKRDPHAFGGLRTLSVDLSKGTGRDRTVLVVADDLGLLDLTADDSISLASAANLAQRKASQWGVPQDRMTYDAGGWAGSDMERYLDAVGIQAAMPYFGSASGGTRYKNRRARSAWRLRQRLDPDRERIRLDTLPEQDKWSLAQRRRMEATGRQVTVQPAWSIPPAVVGPHWDSMRQELLELRYGHGGSKLELEPKELMAERLGRSPDLADTLIMNASVWES